MDYCENCNCGCVDFRCNPGVRRFNTSQDVLDYIRYDSGTLRHGETRTADAGRYECEIGECVFDATCEIRTGHKRYPHLDNVIRFCDHHINILKKVLS